MKTYNVVLTEAQLEWAKTWLPSLRDEAITPIVVSTTDPQHPTNKAWVMTDPEIEKAPTNGESLLVIQQGGVLITSPWVDGYWAWAYKPAIPQSVKDRMYGR